MRSLVFLDVETTGLGPKAQIWEAAYAVGKIGLIRSSLWEHTLTDGEPLAFAVNNYSSRISAYTPDNSNGRNNHENGLKRALKDSTLVAANPAFDAGKLESRWGYAPWHYRLFDIETYAAPALGFATPEGLAKIASCLDVVSPDHSAAGDVDTLRQCFYRLADIYEAEKQTFKKYFDTAGKINA